MLKMAAAAVETGSMQEAAQTFTVSASAISQAVRKAEAHFGVALLHRDRRPMNATQAGLVFVRDVRAATAILGEMDGKVRAAGSETGAVEMRIGLVDTIAATIGASLFKELSASRPSLSLSGRSGIASELSDALARRQVDVIVTCDPARTAQGLECRPLMTEDYLLLLPSTLAGELDGLLLEEVLERQPLVGHSDRSFVGAQVGRYLREQGISARRAFAFDASDAIVALVGEGAGVAITTPLCLLQGAANAGSVTIVPLPGKPLEREIVVISRNDDFHAGADRIAEIARHLLSTSVSQRLDLIAPRLSRHICTSADVTSKVRRVAFA